MEHVLPQAGTLVICDYRLNTAHQYWTMPMWIGTVLEPDDSKSLWNGRNSEREYCEEYGYAPVEYRNYEGFSSQFVQRDSLESLIPLTEIVRAIEGMTGAVR